MKALQVARNLASSLLPALFVCGCLTPEGEVTIEGEFLVFEPIGLGQSGLLRDTTEVVYRREADWHAAHDSLVVTAPFRAVDFDQMMVVLVALPQEHGGYGIEVESVERTARGIVVEYVVTEPASDCLPVVAASLPFQAVRVTQSEGPVGFVRRVEPYRCTWRQ